MLPPGRVVVTSPVANGLKVGQSEVVAEALEVGDEAEPCAAIWHGLLEHRRVEVFAMARAAAPGRPRIVNPDWITDEDSS